MKNMKVRASACKICEKCWLMHQWGCKKKWVNCHWKLIIQEQKRCTISLLKRNTLLVEMLALIIHWILYIDFIPWRAVLFASDCVVSLVYFYLLSHAINLSCSTVLPFIELYSIFATARVWGEREANSKHMDARWIGLHYAAVLEHWWNTDDW
jgi:hypothetical protein